MATGDLTTLARVRAYLKGDFSDDGYTIHDAEIQRLIASVSADVRRQTDRSLDVPAASKTDRVNGPGGQGIHLRQYPVVAVTSVTVDGTPIAAQASTTDTGYYLDGNTVRLVGYDFTKGTGNVSIVYTAGFNAADTTTIPASPYSYAVASAYFGTVSVTIAGVTATLTTGTPTAGQYAVSSTGTYTFAAADAGKALVIVYGSVPADLEQAVIQLVALAFVDADHVGFSTKTLAGGDSVTWNGGPQLANASAIIDRYARIAVG